MQNELAISYLKPPIWARKMRAFCAESGRNCTPGAARAASASALGNAALTLTR